MAQFRFTPGDYRGALLDDVDKMASAATSAMHDAGSAALTGGRASIAAAGFSAGWQNGLQLKTYPVDGKTSLDPAALIYHKIRYSEIFQTGGRINGDPLLWLPIEANLPTSGGAKWTPARYVSSVGALVSINVPGHRPILAAARRRPGERLLPLFVGISAVTLSKKLNVDEAVATEAARLPDLYASKLKSL